MCHYYRPFHRHRQVLGSPSSLRLEVVYVAFSNPGEDDSLWGCVVCCVEQYLHCLVALHFELVTEVHCKFSATLGNLSDALQRTYHGLLCYFGALYQGAQATPLGAGLGWRGGSRSLVMCAWFSNTSFLFS